MTDLARLYRTATYLATPLAWGVLRWRRRIGKEDPARLGERWGRATKPRPPGALLWLHGASVGEALSLLPLMDRLHQDNPTLTMLVTSGTMTSARLLADRLDPAWQIHQFLPLDHPVAVRRFLDHWHPDLALWVESELWPTLVTETRRRGIGLLLVNARMSARSAKGWARWPNFTRTLLGSFDRILTQDETQTARFSALGAETAITIGDLKSAAPPPGADPGRLATLRTLIGDRPVWLAASTHAGDETLVVATHRAARQRLPDLLTLAAPRHPDRCDELTSFFVKQGLTVARHSKGEAITRATDLYLVDTLGDMGLFYRLAPVTLIGGTFGASGSIGGHNPMEAASLGCALIHGPDYANADASTRALDAGGGALLVADGADLGTVVTDLLSDPPRTAAMGAAARTIAAANQSVLAAIITEITPFLPHGPTGGSRHEGP